jgi:carboxylesterase
MEKMTIMPGAEPFLFSGGTNGILLVHGFTGTPAEMRLLGEHLHAAGYTVMGIRLPGHGTSPHDMVRTNWHHWYGSVVDGLILLRGFCSNVQVVGLSMGGLLALKLAAEYPVDAVAALSTPVFLANKRIKLLPLYRLFCRFVPKKRRDYDIDPQYFIGYDTTPLSCLASLLELIRIVGEDVRSIQCPVLLVQSKRERTVKPSSAPYLLERIGSSQKEIFWLEKSGHVVTIDIERETVFRRVAEFANQTRPK